MASSDSRLTALQRATLEAFFARERGFYLTGGAALAGFYLRHRETDDLDLFTPDPAAFERGRPVLQDVAIAVGAKLVIKQAAPGFLRALLTSPDEELVVDLVHESTQQVSEEKRESDGVRLDPPEEILANKLTAAVGRQEWRDLIDLYCLERMGLRVEDALTAAHAKDGGCTPGTLAWLLESFPLPPEERLPSGISLDALAAWRGELVSRLRRAAFPGEALL